MIAGVLERYQFHFNPLPPHGGRLFQRYTGIIDFFISIHSLRMEGDSLGTPVSFVVFYFNPLPPHGGRRLSREGRQRFPYFNPLPPHGGRRCIGSGLADSLCISIHSLRMEGDIYTSFNSMFTLSFQSTPSAWRETDIICGYRSGSSFQSTPSAWRETDFNFEQCANVNISIHSLRMEGDATPSAIRYCSKKISIHSLRMEGDSSPGGGLVNGNSFQSTPSAWRETEHLLRRNRQSLISIHSLRMEGD